MTSTIGPPVLAGDRSIAGARPVPAAPDEPIGPRPSAAPVVEPIDASIVVSCHDYGEYVGDAVRSALAQQGARVEVIVVDDGSTDDSPAVLDDLVRTQPGRIEVITQPNRGQAAAMNAGFARSRAPVVLFLDADDVLHPRTAARCVDALTRPGAARVQFPMRVVDRVGCPIGRLLPDDPAQLPTGDVREAVLSHPDDLAWQPTSGNAFTRDALARILPMPEGPYRTCADHYLSNLSALLGDVVVLDGVGADYRVHGANADHRDHLDLWRLRTVIGHTVATHVELGRLARDLDHEFPSDPLAVPSVTFFVNRLVSLRLAPDRHPLHGDRRLRLVLAGARASWRRQDLSHRRRAAMVGWFVATGVAPRPVARSLAESALLGRRRGRVDPTSASGTSADRDRPSPVARRSDWRFLLARPTAATGVRRAVVHGAPLVSTASALFDLELADVVDRDDRPAGATVVAEVGTTNPDVGAVATALAPGGQAWIEVDRRRRGSRMQSPARVARRARAAGLSVDATYALAPSPERARCSIPLDHAGAVMWYLRNQVVPGTWAQALGLGGLRMILAVAGTRPLAAVVPAFGMVVHRPPCDRGSILPAAVAGARDPAAASLVGVAGSRTLLLTSGQDAASRAVLLPFAPGARRPSSVVKVAAVGSFGVDTVAELDRLADLAERLPVAVASAIPTPVAQAPLGRLVVGAQASAPGCPMEVRARSVTSRPRRTIADLDAATDWLTELHLATLDRPVEDRIDPSVGGAPFWQRWVLDPLDDLRLEVVGPGSAADRPVDRAVLRRDLDCLEVRSLSAIAAGCGAELPTVERHHDFVPCNVLRSGRGLSVVDWEISPGRDRTGPALVDLLLFVTFWYGAAHRSSSPEQDLRWLDRLLGSSPDERDDPYHAASWRAVDRYCRSLAIDPAVTPLALTSLWLERHASAVLRAQRLGSSRPSLVASPVATQLAVLARRWPLTGGPWLVS